MYRGFRDTCNLPFYFQGYRILSILLPGIWDTVFNILATFRDIDYLGNKRYLPVHFEGYATLGTPPPLLYKPRM